MLRAIVKQVLRSVLWCYKNNYFYLQEGAQTSIYLSVAEEVTTSGEYYADWTASVGAVLYEIWAGDTQTTFLLSSVSITVPMGLLLPGLSLSVRAQDGSGNYSVFSNIEVVV